MKKNETAKKQPYLFIFLCAFIIFLAMIILDNVYKANYPNQKNATTIVEEKLIGSTFKTLAKAFVATTNLDELKQGNMLKLISMDTGKFKTKYRKVYPFIKDLPSDIRQQYGIQEDMSKDQAIKNINSIDKKRAYGLIDSIPDTTIASIYEKYCGEIAKQIQKNNIIQEIHQVWSNLTANIEKNKTVKVTAK